MSKTKPVSIPAVAIAVSGFQLLISLTLCAQTADSFDAHLAWISPPLPYDLPHADGLAIQPDGRFLVGGKFNTVNGVTRFDLARFDAVGALDTTFTPVTTGAAILVGVFPDGRILAYNQVTAPFYSSYLPGGNADPAFSLWAMPNDAPSASLIYPDGKFVAATWGPDLPLRRWNADGSEDFSLAAYFGPPFTAEVKALALQRDGKILVGGILESANNVPRSGLARLNPDGSTETAFSPSADLGGGPGGGWIECMAVQKDGKILIAGGFDAISGVPCDGIARLNPDGTLDSSFTASLPHSLPDILVNSIALQADGMIIVGGSFDTLNGQSVLNLARLNPDGSLDASFNPAPNREVTSLALDASGRLLVGGYFSNIGGQARKWMARLLNTGPATESLSYQGNTVTWLRGGTAPEVLTTTFELSTNGSTWTLLGEGAPIMGGWQLTGVSVPLGSRIRARGFLASGKANASLGVVESMTTVAPTLNIQRLGSNVVLSWAGATFGLQSAPTITGTFTNIPGATSPYTNAITEGQRFFRLGISTSCSTGIPGLLAHEPFDYAAGLTLDTMNGGTGFSGPWSSTIGGPTYFSAGGSLNFSPLCVSGGRLTSAPGHTQMARTLASDFGADGSTRYFSFLLRPDGVLNAGDFGGFHGLELQGAEALFIGKPGADALESYVLEDVGGARQVASSVTAVVGETVLLVVKAEFAAGNDTFTLYVNPAPGSPEPATGTVKSDLDLGTSNTLLIYSGGEFSLDELRFGETFESVTPH